MREATNTGRMTVEALDPDKTWRPTEDARDLKSFYDSQLDGDCGFSEGDIQAYLNRLWKEHGEVARLQPIVPYEAPEYVIRYDGGWDDGPRAGSEQRVLDSMNSGHLDWWVVRSHGQDPFHYPYNAVICSPYRGRYFYFLATLKLKGTAHDHQTAQVNARHGHPAGGAGGHPTPPRGDDHGEQG